MSSDPRTWRLTAPVPAEVVLACRGVTKLFGDHAVLRGVDLDVGQHKAVVLIGVVGFGQVDAPALCQPARDGQ